MFTGIIEKQVKIKTIDNGQFTVENPFGDILNTQDLSKTRSLRKENFFERSLSIYKGLRNKFFGRGNSPFFRGLTIGQSIAHDGACMTLTDITPESYSFFAMEETLCRTNFGTKKVGDTFNIERCLIMDGRLDGHFVTGHIDTTGIVMKVEDKSDSSRVITISFPSENANLMVEKGSITVNGVSLTIVDVGADFFTISLIPHTLEVTNIGKLAVNDIVNLEFDLLGKYVAKQMKKL